jgi:hypothetical protein
MRIHILANTAVTLGYNVKEITPPDKVETCIGIVIFEITESIQRIQMSWL